MFFLKGRRRRRLLESPLDDRDRALMHRVAPLTRALPPDRARRHEGVVQVLLAEKHFEGTAGLDVIREMELAVAGQAALLQLRPDADYYPGLDTVLIYPEAFKVAFARHGRLCRRRREVLFDEDAAESPAEFFATAVELFFEFPRDLAAEYPDVHAVLAAWLHLDPAAWTFA